MEHFFAIACCSGDGVVHYAIDTLYQQNIDIPVFCIPAGHGVGVASSILGCGNQTVAAFSIAKGFRRKLDIMKITENGKVLCYNSLLTSWGMVADVEFDTAGLRWIGAFRYRLGGVAAILRKSSLHHLRLSYIPVKNSSMTFCTGEGCKICSRGTKDARKLAKKIPTDVLLDEDPNSEDSEGEDEEWTTEEGYFLVLNASVLSDTTSNHRIAPYAHASDGCIDLVYIRDTSRSNVLQLFNTLKNGSFVDSNFHLEDQIGYVKVKKFKVEPLDKNQVASLDGILHRHDTVLEGSVLPSAVTLGA